MFPVLDRSALSMTGDRAGRAQRTAEWANGNADADADAQAI
jgi:hypothetical protein